MKFCRLAALLAMSALSSLAAGQATQLNIVAPLNVGVGAAFSMTVKAIDANQNINTSYTGTISLSSTDTNASFSPQPPYTFTLADAGIHSFQVHLNTTSTQTIFVNDGNLNGNAAINVSASALNTTTTIASSSNPSVYGQLVNFTITVQPNGPPPTGNIAYFDNGRFINTQVVNCCSGQATVSANQLPAGVHSLTAQYSGDNNYVANVSNPFSQTVNKATTTVTVAASPNPAQVNQTDQLTANVSSSAGACPGQIPCPTGTVTFFDGATPIGSSAPVGFDGSSLIFPSFSTTGNHPITAEYNGDTNFLASTSSVLTLPVNQNVTGTTPSTTSITSTPNPANVGQQVTFTIAVTGAGSTPTGTVNLLDPTFGPGPFNSLTLDASGQASFSTSLPPGNHTITADYQGDATFMGSSGQVNQVVSASSKKPTTTSVGSSANPAVSGQSITFTATVSHNVAGNPTGTMSFTEGGGPLGTASLNPTGQATLGPLTLGIGYHLIRAQYDGDANFADSKSSALNQIVNGTGTSPTTVSMSPSVNPATRGQSVTFNVAVVGSGNPGGSVVVFDGPQALGIVTLNVSSQGNLTTSNVGAGNHSITAHYFGDANFGPSDSTAFVQTVTATDTDFLVPPGPAANPRGIVTGPDGNLWFTEIDRRAIGRISTGGTLTEFPVPGGLRPNQIVKGPDGNLWFTDNIANFIGRITPAGVITEFPVAAGSQPIGIAKGPDGALWFAEAGSGSNGKIGRIDPANGNITQFPVGSDLQPFLITLGGDGNNLWFTDLNAPIVAKMTTGGRVTRYAVPSGSIPFSIVGGPDGNVWFTEGFFDGKAQAVAKITPAGAVTEFSTSNIPGDITVGPDNRLWFRESNEIGAINVNGALSEYQCGGSGCINGGRGIAKGPDGGIWMLNSGVAGRVASVDTSGIRTHLYALPAGNKPNFITAGQDGNLWFTQLTAASGAAGVGRITSAGVITQFTPPNTVCPEHITPGPDGNVWMADDCSGFISSIAPDGSTTQFFASNFAFGGGGGAPFGIATGSDGNLWVTDDTFPVIYQFTPSGQETDFLVPPYFFNGTGNALFGITSGPDGNLWYANAQTNSIGQITTGGIISEFPLPAGVSFPYAITTGSDGNLWFVDEDATGTVGKIDPNTFVITIYPGNTFGCGQDINSGSDGNLWVNVSFCYPRGQDLASIDPATGAITTFTGTTYPLSGVVGITNGPDGNLWTADFDGGRISTMRAISFTGISSPSNPGPGTVSAVATFKVGDPNAQLNDFTATIDWGDGTPVTSSPGPVTFASPGLYQIDAGSHNYAQAGTFTVTFKLHDSITAADYIGTSQAKLGLPTNTILTSSANPVGEGFILTLSAHVTPASPGTPPNGTVAFMDAGVTLGSAPVDADGYAELSIAATTANSLAPADHNSLNNNVGSSNISAHPITAVYSGDSTYLGSTSPVLNQIVAGTMQGLLFDNEAFKAGTDGSWVDGTVGDFNGDGIPDIAAAGNNSSNTGEVSIFVGNGNGTFSPSQFIDLQSLEVSSSPVESVVAGDFDNDGKLDLEVTVNTQVFFLKGNGDGSFQYPQDAGTKSAATAAVVGDFNRDGKLDLAIAEAGSSLIKVLLGDGTGLFPVGNVVGTTVPGSPQHLVVADFNRDGKLDLAASAISAGGELLVLLGNGDGSFGPAAPYGPATVGFAIATGDLNGDGRADLVVSDYTTTNLNVYLNNGNGSFGTPVAYSIASSGALSVGCWPAMGDVDRDGHADVVADCGQGGRLLLGNGDGTLQPSLFLGDTQGTPKAVKQFQFADFNRDAVPDILSVDEQHVTSIMLVSPGPQDPSYQAAVNLPAGPNPNSIALGEFNRNGKLDIAVADFNNTAGIGSIGIIHNNGNGSFQPFVSFPVTTGHANFASVGDLDGDGIPDVVTSLDNGQIEVFLASGPGVLYNTSGGSPFGSVTADFNGDGKPDVAVGNANGTVSVLFGNGDGTLQPAAQILSLGQPATYLAAGDFNRDGKLDLAVPDLNNNVVYILLNNGNGTFNPFTTIPDSSPQFIKVGDFNRDGKLDIVVSNNGFGTVSVLLGDGSGNFFAPVSYPAGSDPHDMAVVDFNRDGIPDLAVSDGNGGVTLLAGTGDGGFRLAGNYAAGAGATDIAAADLNGDGIPDLVTSNFDGNSVSVLASGTKKVSTTNYSAGTTPDAVAIGDFDGDGISDMAVANAGSNDITIRLGNGDGTFGAIVATYPVGTNPSSIAAGDFNGDGHLDLAVTNKDSDNVSILFGDGSGTFTLAGSPIPLAAGAKPVSVSVSDIDGDNNLDLAVANSGNATITVLFGDGTGGFTVGPTVFMRRGSPLELAPMLSTPKSVKTGDLNGDGKPDMIVADSGFSIIGVLLNDGTNDPFKSLTGYNVGSQPSGIALGDFNGDGKLDIAVSNQNSNDVTVLINNGAGLFPVSHTLAAGHGPSSIVVMDYNHDGKPDIAVSNSGDNNIMVMLGNGDGTFQPAITLAAGSSPVALAVGNLTGGGFSDLIVANAVGNNVGVLLNTAAVLMQEADAGPTTYGAMAMFTASVTPAVKSNQTPGGSVTFASCSTMPTTSGCPAGGSTLATSSVNGQGTATGGTGTLPAGTSFITATYSGNGSFNPGNIVITHTVTQAPTSLALSFSVNPAGFAQTVLLIATATSTTGAAPTGSVSFTDVTSGSVPLGSATLVGGQAGLPVSSLTLGSHTIQANYTGDGNFLAATAPAQATVTILPAATSATLSSSRTTSVYGQSVTLHAQVTSLTGGTPTGNVTFLDGANALATVATDNGGFANFTANALSAGVHSLTVAFADPSQHFKATGSAPLTQTVTPAATRTEILSSANPWDPSKPTLQLIATVAGQFGGEVTGSVNFIDSANGALGSVNLVSGTATLASGLLSNGLHTITASYVPDSNNQASTDGLMQLINPLGLSDPQISFTASMNPVHRNQHATLNVVVSVQGVGPTPTGLVRLVDDDTILGGVDQTLDGSGAAEFDITDRFTIGEHTIMAVYEGDGTYAGAIAFLKVNRTPKPR